MKSMKKQTFILVAFCLSCLSFSFASEAKPLSVVVVGGGPTGLGTAIEAHLSGADVTVIEKRQKYIRVNTLFLYTVTLELFNKWKVSVPNMAELEFKGQRRGFVLIKDLEDSLTKRVHELGIRRVQGEFRDFVEGERAAIIQTADGEILLPYDVLVGADGANSRVREKLEIPCTTLGYAIAGMAMVSATNPEKKIGAEIRTHKDIFAKKVTVPNASILFIQSRPDSVVEEMGKNELAHFTYAVGWQEEAEKIEEGGILSIENVPVYLQRATVFYHPHKSAILLGDAAGSASFYQGMGANFSLKSTELAGELFRQFHEETALASFERNMEKAVDVLMQDSLPLFAN